MTTLIYGNGVHPVQADAKSLREINLLPNIEYMETLLKVVDFAAPEIGDPLDRDMLSTLLIDLCLTRYFRDPIGQAALALDTAPGNTYPGDVEASLWNDFVEMFPSLHHDEAKLVARRLIRR